MIPESVTIKLKKVACQTAMVRESKLLGEKTRVMVLKPEFCKEPVA